MIDSSPTDVVLQFESALRGGDIRGARKMMYAGSNLPEEAELEINDKLQTWHERIASGAHVTPLAEKRADDAALVIIHDHSTPSDISRMIDLDPVFLLRDATSWVVVMEDPFRPNRFMSFTADQLSQFKELHAWFEEQQPQMQAAIRNRANEGK
jgi:hypothetical protein